jgi:uncharacterized protein YuzE
MKYLSIDPEADALYLPLQDKKISYTKELKEHIIIDFDENDKAIGVEILFVSDLFKKPKSEIEKLSREEIIYKLSDLGLRKYLV